MCQDEISHALSDRAYNYLLKNREWIDLKQYCSADYEVVYLKGKPNEESETNVIIPVKNPNLNWKRIDYLFRIFGVKVITLAFSDGESNFVFYDLRKGLCEPPVPLHEELELEEEI